MATKEWGGTGPQRLLPSAFAAPGPSALAARIPLGSTASAAAWIAVDAPRLRAAADPIDIDDNGRSKIWQLGTSLHCSVVGTCLTTGELRSLLRKFNAITAEKPTDHDLHAVAVSAVGKRTPLAKQIQKALDRRHGTTIRRFARAASAAELREMWDSALQSGDIPGAYWAVLTHPQATDALVRHVFGDVHMLSHIVGAANRADIRRLHQLEKEKAALEEKLAAQQVHLRDSIVAREEKILALGTMLSAQLAQTAVSAPAEDDAREAATLRQLVGDLRTRLDKETERRVRAERRANELATARAAAERSQESLERQAAALRRELEAAEIGIAALAEHEGEPEDALDLRGLTVLYVGGRPHLIARLKALVERAAGELIHHDGGIEDRKDLLAGLVSRADVALFPVDCISHDAAQSLKRLALQAGKTFVPLRSASVASLLTALRALDLQRLTACGT